MTSGCGDTLSLADLQIAKKHQLFEAEVITGKQGGIAGGADIDYATNQVTGQTQKTMPAILRDLGYTFANFTFETGGTLTADDRESLVLWPSPAGDDNYYVWHGELPKVIPAGSSPASTGGESSTTWEKVIGASFLLTSNALSEFIDAGLEFQAMGNLNGIKAFSALWERSLRKLGFNFKGFMVDGVIVTDKADVIVSKDFASGYVYTGILPHAISEAVDNPLNPLWVKITDGLAQGTSVTIENALNYGAFNVSRKGDFMVPGLIPGGYNRTNRNFSEGQSYKYGTHKQHKYTFGVFEDACVLSAISCERNLERPTQILGAGTGQSVAQYGSTDTAATYFENYALPPLVTTSTATFSATGASGLSLNPELIKLNMVAVVVGASITWFGLIRAFTATSITVDGWYEKTSGNQSTPSGTLYISPVYRVWGNNTIVTVPTDAAATSAVGTEVMLNLYKPGTGVDSQIYKAINNNAFNPNEIVDSAYQAVGKFGKAHDVWPGSTYSYRSWGAVNYGFFSDHDQSAIKILTPNGNALVLASQVGGVGAETNVLIIDPAGSITQTNQKGVNAIAAQFGPNGATGVTIRQQSGSGASSVDSVMTVGKSAATNRSISAAGTINASGADYAEYCVKAPGCGIIKAGDICGVDKNGELTDIFDKAISFVVKSTDPCMVGGDIWLTPERPQFPSQEWVTWDENMRKQPPQEPDKSFINSMIKAGFSAEEANIAFTKINEEYVINLDSYEKNRQELLSNEPSQKSEEYLKWEIDIESARQKVDRIAFCGRVPVNISGGNAGDYMIPVRTQDGKISAIFKSTPDFEQFKSAIGRVWSVTDGVITLNIIMH